MKSLRRHIAGGLGPIGRFLFIPFKLTLATNIIDRAPTAIIDSSCNSGTSTLETYY